ncbi:hypothetical protein RJT34_24028 [Clitoria ternatea]|uniref:Uncharacterized protein n=1 Tax=Clitoria ternatea TaxID=43366 RepID=A0AAN9FM41_CLITE
MHHASGMPSIVKRQSSDYGPGSTEFMLCLSSSNAVTLSKIRSENSEQLLDKAKTILLIFLGQVLYKAGFTDEFCCDSFIQSCLCILEYSCNSNSYRFENIIMYSCKHLTF